MMMVLSLSVPNLHSNLRYLSFSLNLKTRYVATVIAIEDLPWRQFIDEFINEIRHEVSPVDDVAVFGDLTQEGVAV